MIILEDEMSKQKLTTMGVWIELQEPSDEYTAQEIVDNANKMLNKLGINGNRFAVSKERKYGTHYLHVQSDGQFSYMESHGHWFNLEYLAKED
jgi:hypothetical protein